MKKLLVMALACLLVTASWAAMAETIDLGELTVEVPAGFVEFESDDTMRSYLSQDETEGLLILIVNMSAPLENIASVFAYSQGYSSEDVLYGYETNNIPHARLNIVAEDGTPAHFAIFAGEKAGYEIGYFGENELTWLNLLSSIHGTGIIGMLNYEVVSTSEYAKTPYQGIAFRVYTPDGEVDAETAEKIFWELADSHMEYDLCTVFFYTSREAADGSGMAYGQVAQDDFSTVPEFEAFQY